MRVYIVKVLFIVLAAGTTLTESSNAAVVVDKGEEKVRYLDAGDTVEFEPVKRHRGFFENDLRTYCYSGNAKTLGRLFESVELQLDIANDDYTQYEGATPAEVREHYDEQRSLFSFSLFSQKRARLPLSPFNQQCIGIETVQSYRVRLHLSRVDFWRVIQLAAGVTLFIYAGQLSSNSLFYYITGILLGICSSFMLLIWLSSKLVPRRPVMYGVLIGGWAVGVYVIQMLWENLQLILLTYRTYVFWYICITGLVSFFFCYRLGPPKNQRSKNIVKWLLQLIALLLIYFSSQFEEASAALIILTVVSHYFPRRLLHRIRGWYRGRFPRKRRLLTNAEYYAEGVRETTRALEELRTYASSPECKQWKVMSKLRDPLRFAAFVEGASHLRDEEILHFEGAKYDNEFLEDSEMSADEGELVPEQRQNGAPYPLHRSQRGVHLNRQRSSFVSREEMSEDDEEDDDDVIEVPTSATRFASNSSSSSNNYNFNRQHTPTRSRTLHPNAINGYLSSRASPLQQQQRVLNRSAHMVAAAKRRSSSRHNSIGRAAEMRDDYSAESDNY